MGYISQHGLKPWLVERLRRAQAIAVVPDESTDVSTDKVLLAYVYYVIGTSHPCFQPPHSAAPSDTPAIALICSVRTLLFPSPHPHTHIHTLPLFPCVIHRYEGACCHAGPQGCGRLWDWACRCSTHPGDAEGGLRQLCLCADCWQYDRCCPQTQHIPLCMSSGA